jgi:glutathione peroxidase
MYRGVESEKRLDSDCEKARRRPPAGFYVFPLPSGARAGLHRNPVGGNGAGVAAGRGVPYKYCRVVNSRMEKLMKCIVSLIAGFAFALAATAAEKGEKMASPLSCKMKGLDGKEIDLSQYKGKVVLFVNVASKCGNTPQYAGLEKLYETYSKDGLVIIGVPANEFGKQEPGTDEEIAKFCDSKYHVTFPMLSKVVVKGEGICPLYQTLTAETTAPVKAGPISWNFEKFLVGRDGKVAGRFAPKTKPDDAGLVSAIKAELEKK